MDGEEAESRSGGTAGKGSGTYRARRSPRVRPVEQRCRAPGAGGAAGQVRSGPEVPPPPPAPVPPPHPRKRKRSAWGAALSVGTDRHRAATTPRSSSFHSNLNTDQKERKKPPKTKPAKRRKEKPKKKPIKTQTHTHTKDSGCACPQHGSDLARMLPGSGRRTRPRSPPAVLPRHLPPPTSHL